MALKILSGIDVTGGMGITAADVPDLSASKITSGTFATSHIPNLDASKITTGAFADARIASAANWNTAYGWGNHAGLYLGATAKAADSNLLDGIDSGSFLRSDASDSFSGILTGTASGENLKVGGIRGAAKGSQTGEYIHLYERVHIGGPNGWGAATHSAPGYGLSTWGSVNFGMNGSGVIQLNGTTIVTSARALTNVTNTNWDTAYGWGNHASAGYLTTSSAASTYAPKASPALTGTPTAPTAAAATNTTQIATTAFVQTAVSNLVDSAPGALNTLNELAAALGDDASFSTTMTTALGNRLRIDTNAQGLTATQKSNGRTNLGLGTLATLSTVNAATITDNSVGAAELNVTGNGSNGQVLARLHLRKLGGQLKFVQRILTLLIQ
jgi:hypothetical protein